MNFTFKPTILSGIILAALCFWCGAHISFTISALIPAAGLLAVISFIVYISYRLGRFSVLHDTEDQDKAQYEKIATQAEQIDEISLMPSIALFPDIQIELYEMAIQKYAEIGNIDRANQIRASLENIIV